MLKPKEIPQLLEFGCDSDYGEDVFYVSLKGTPLFICKLK